MANPLEQTALCHRICARMKCTERRRNSLSRRGIRGAGCWHSGTRAAIPRRPGFLFRRKASNDIPIFTVYRRVVRTRCGSTVRIAAAQSYPLRDRASLLAVFVFLKREALAG